MRRLVNSVKTKLYLIFIDNKKLRQASRVFRNYCWLFRKIRVVRNTIVSRWICKLQYTPILLSYWFACIILYHGRANGNRTPLFHFPSVSYINPDFQVADYSACHLLSRWFLAELIFSTLKMEAICFSETSVDFKRTTRRYIQEDRTLQTVMYQQILVEVSSAKFHENPFSSTRIVSCEQRDGWTERFKLALHRIAKEPKHLKPLSRDWIHGP
jgi:hypothetical protein